MHKRSATRKDDLRTPLGCAYRLCRQLGIIDDSLTPTEGADLHQALRDAIRDKRHNGRRFLYNAPYEDMFAAMVEGYRDWFFCSLRTRISRTRLFQLEIYLASRMPRELNTR